MVIRVQEKNCKTCGGVGMIAKPYYVGDYLRFIDECCPDCEGYGVIFVR